MFATQDLQADSWQVRVRPAAIPGLDPQQEGAIEVSKLAALPDGSGLIATQLAPEHPVYVLPWDSAPRLAPEFHLDGESFANPLGLFNDDRHLLIIRGDEPTLTVYDQQGRPASTLRGWSTYSTDGFLWLPPRLYVLGTPSVAPAGEAPRWDDLRWVRRHLRSDCRLYSVEPHVRQPRQVPLLCDPVFASNLALALPGGQVLALASTEEAEANKAETDLIVAGFEARPYLSIFDTSGQQLADFPYLQRCRTDSSDCQLSTELTRDELHKTFSDPEEAWRLRASVPWFQGLLRWPGVIGVVLRHTEGTEVRFTVSLFDPRGTPLAHELPLDLPTTPRNRSQITTVVLPARAGQVTNQAGILHTIFGAPGEIDSQRFSYLELTAQGAPEEASRTSQLDDERTGIRFTLLDARTGEQVTATQVRLEQGTTTRMLDLQAEDGTYTLRRDLEPGPITLHLEPHLHAPLDVEAQLQPVGLTHLGTLLVEAGATVIGQVWDVALGEPRRASHADHAGRFLLPHIPPGTYQLQASQLKTSQLKTSAAAAEVVRAVHIDEHPLPITLQLPPA